MVCRFLLQATVLYVNDFIESTRGVKSKNGGKFIFSHSHFCIGKPPSVAEGEFHFVSVKIDGVCFKNGMPKINAKFTDSGNSVFNNLFFLFQLGVVVEMLPFTPTTLGKMRANGFNSVGAKA